MKDTTRAKINLIQQLSLSCRADKENSESEDLATPPELIEKMVEVGKVKEKFKQNPNIRIVDPCVGDGAILIYLNEELNIPKDQLFGIDIDIRHVKIAKLFGFKHVVCGDCLDKKTWEKLYNSIEE